LILGITMNSSKNIEPEYLMVIEIIAGFFGFLGIAWIISGRWAIGTILLLSFWLILTIEIVVFSILSLIVVGLLGFILIPLQNIFFGVISAVLLKSVID